MSKYIHPFLRAPDGETGAGGAATQSNPISAPGYNPFMAATQPETTEPAKPAETTVAPETQQQQTTTQTAPAQSQQTQATPTTPPAVALSPDQLQQLMAAARQPASPAQAGQPQMSEAEFKKAFNIYEASEDTYEKLFGVKPQNPAQVAALNETLQAISRQSVAINRYLLETRAREIEAKLTPVQADLQQKREQEEVATFVNEYPGFKDYVPLLREIVDAGRARNMKFNSLSEARQFVAVQAAKMLNRPLDTFKVASGGASSSQSTSSQTTTQQSGRSMATTSMGGRSGTSGGTAPATGTAERIFS